MDRKVPQLRRPDLSGRPSVLQETLAVGDLTAIRFLVAALTGWLNHAQKEVVARLGRGEPHPAGSAAWPATPPVIARILKAHGLSDDLYLIGAGGMPAHR